MATGIFVWLALSPGQMRELLDRGRVSPDLNSNRFDLSANTSSAESLTETVLVMEGPVSEYPVLRMEITALGYFLKMEGNTLERVSPGEFCWHGTMELEEVDGEGRLLYRVIVEPAASSTMPSHEPPVRRNLRN